MKQLETKTVILSGCCIIVFSLCNCRHEKDPLAPDANTQYAIYLLKNSETKTAEILDKDLSELQLQNQPWLSNEDIEFYDWSSHCIYLKGTKDDLFPFPFGLVELNDYWMNVPLVAVANGQECYPISGNGWNFYGIPDIDLTSLLFFPEDVLYVGWPYPFASDQRENDQIKQALIRAGLYHAGIDVRIDTTNALTVIDNGDTATIEYTFTLINNDTDDLYLFDPDIVGSDIYHYFSNGAVFYNDDENKLYGSRFKESQDPEVDWSPNWYTKLPSGQSIQRTVRLKGFPHFSNGTYFFRVNYGGPRIDKKNRNATDGRYWFPGEKWSNLLIWINQEQGTQKAEQLMTSNLSNRSGLKIFDDRSSTNEYNIIK